MCSNRVVYFRSQNLNIIGMNERAQKGDDHVTKFTKRK